MEIGDLVSYQGQRWLVMSFDRVSRLMTLVNFEGGSAEIPREYDRTHKTELQVIANPSRQWGLLTAKIKGTSAGPFVRVVDPAPIGKPEKVLEPWQDWVPSDFARSGGSFFVNPEVGLLPGTVLIATHRNGTSIRVPVPKTFGTVTERKNLVQRTAAAKVVTKKPKEHTRFSRLLADDDEI